MKRDIRSIRKQFRLTETEEKQILDLMREKSSICNLSNRFTTSSVIY